MKHTLGRKLVMNFALLLLAALCIASCTIIESQIDHHNGANTEQVDPSNIITISSPLAITNVNVISPDSTQMLENLTVLIENGKITRVDQLFEIDQAYTVIDGTGKYLIPGLIDTHTHLARSKNDLLLYLALGVTQIANMSSLTDNTYLDWREEAENGALSPKIYIAAGGMTSKSGVMVKLKTYFGGSPGDNTADQARAAVQQFKRQGYDAIKAYNVNREAYLALNDEAKKIGIPVVGHLASELTLDDLYNSGQSQLAHIEEITKATIREFGGLSGSNGDEYLDYLKLHASEIAANLRKRNISISTTLWLMESLPNQRYDTHNFLNTIELEYQNPGIIEGSRLAPGWLPGRNPYQAQITISENDLEQLERSKNLTHVYVKAIQLMLKALADNNVTILAGTDSNAACTIAGFSLHDELESLSAAGMTNEQVLRSATLAPAQWLHSNSGRITDGYRADLVLLNENPLADIKNTRTIHAVIANGHFLSRQELDKILTSIKQANNNSRKISIDEYLVDSVTLIRP